MKEYQLLLNKFKYVLETMFDMYWHAFEHSLLGKTELWLKETEKNK